MNTINHTSVVKYTVGGTTRSIVESISRSDLHHRVSQLQHINIEPQARALFFSAQRSPTIKVRATTPHVRAESDREISLHQSLRCIYPFCLIPSSSWPFVLPHENKWKGAASCRGQRSSSWLRRPSGFVTLFLHVVMAVQGEPGSPALPRNDNRKVGRKKKKKRLMRNANHIGVAATRSKERQVRRKWKPETPIPLKDKEVNGKEKLTEGCRKRKNV